MACNRTPCGRPFEDSGSDGDLKKPVVVPKVPRKSLFTRLWESLAKALFAFLKFCRGVRDDPYKWMLFKSTVYFLMGLKLFYELSKYLAPKPCGIPYVYKKCPSY